MDAVLFCGNGLVGDELGFSNGSLNSLNEGDAEGLFEGDDDGRSLGLEVGRAVGSFDGLPVISAIVAGMAGKS